MIRRYTLPEMGAIWSEEARFGRMLEVELAVTRAQARRGRVPAEALTAIEQRAKVDVARIDRPQLLAALGAEVEDRRAGEDVDVRRFDKVLPDDVERPRGQQIFERGL